MRSSSAGVRGSPIRTCVGCGVRAAKSDLLRVVAVGGEAVADPAARRPGRGAYLHPREDCVERARRRRAIPRALRASGPLADGGLVGYVRSLTGAGDGQAAGRAEGDRARRGPHGEPAV